MEHERMGKTEPSVGGALLVEPSVNGQSHILVNSGFVDIALNLYGTVTVMARASHVDALEAYLDAEKLQRITFIRYEKQRLLESYRKEVASHRYDCVIFLNINYNLFLRLNLLAHKRSNGPLYWVGHSHFLTFEDSGPAAAIKNKLKKMMMFNRLFNSTFIVCGQRIKSNVDALVDAGDKVKGIFHPIGINRLADSQPEATLEPGTFSLLHINGWHQASPSKIAAIQSVEAIAAQRKVIRFKDVKASIATDKDERYFSRDYKVRLGIIRDYSYFLHLPENAYRLQASGALMDLLLIGTPVIGLRSDFGTELAGIIGDFGYFFDSYAEIVAFLGQADAAQIIADRARFSQNLLTGYQTVKDLSLAQARQVLQ
jgi:hypothetical protein